MMDGFSFHVRLLHSLLLAGLYRRFPYVPEPVAHKSFRDRNPFISETGIDAALQAFRKNLPAFILNYSQGQ
jgi:hypothetical protein